MDPRPYKKKQNRQKKNLCHLTRTEHKRIKSHPQILQQIKTIPEIVSERHSIHLGTKVAPLWHQIHVSAKIIM